MTQDDMHEVRIMTDFVADGIGIYVTMNSTMGRRILRPQGRNFTWELVEPATNVEPSLVVSDGHGRALMNALLAHYNGTPDSHTQRADLMHERERRDKLEDHILWVLEQNNRPPRPSVTGYGGSGSVHVSGGSSGSGNAPGR